MAWSKVFLAPGCTLSCMDEALCFHGDFILCAYNTAVMMMTYKLRIHNCGISAAFSVCKYSIHFLKCYYSYHMLGTIIAVTVCWKHGVINPALICLEGFTEDILQQRFRHACMKCIDNGFSCCTCKHALCLSLTFSIQDLPIGITRLKELNIMNSFIQ